MGFIVADAFNWEGLSVNGDILVFLRSIDNILFHSSVFVIMGKLFAIVDEGMVVWIESDVVLVEVLGL